LSKRKILFFRASQGLGTINISNNTGSSVNPQIGTSGNNNVYVTWHDMLHGMITPLLRATMISCLQQITITV